ncbi:S41 family peptidase [Burkholderia sp. Bp8998]|uniref:S41 family peptidase n=1 Tax=Burkholderia sp. Bp8998 TaxID=2184557 RepID=UPI000F5A17F2|nr:S41 family peptidase [Burkholderia sp. Bp8998]RQS17359.1 PDZ domain-containing protein [Burkholderia sp. Bp8998]
MMPATRVVHRIVAWSTGAAAVAAFVACASAARAQSASAPPATPPAAAAAASQPSPCPPDWEPQFCELKAAVEVLKQQHLTDVDIGALLDATVHDGIKTLPHARFFTAQERQQQLDDERRARDGTPGIGIVFETRPDGLHIIDVIPDAPAEQAGVRPDDLVVAMNDQSVVGIDSSEVVKLAKGDAGVPLKLTVRRGPNPATLIFAPVRAIVKPRPATAKRLAGDILYTRLASFPEPAVGNYIDAVQAARRAGPPVKGVILDLRINGGGALNAAIGITALFAGRDRTAMVTLERDGTKRRRFTTNWPDYELPVMHGQDPLAPLQADDWWRTVPLVVLVDGQSASAAEATAAALKDLGRARLLGMPTYGKGLAQTGVDLIDGTRLNFTFARNLRPNGCPMDGYGVVPDWLVPPRRDSDVDGVLLWYREVDLARAPYADRLAPDPFAQVRKARQKLREARVRAKIEPSRSAALPQREFGTADDWQLRQALNALAQRAIATVDAKPWLMPAKPMCKPEG